MEITTTSLDQIFNILTSLILMQVFSRYKPTQHVLILLRILYGVVQFLFITILYLTKKKIEKINDKRTFLTQDNDNNDIRQTYSQYDKSEYSKLLRSTILQIPIVLFLHLKFNLPQPLTVQILNTIRNIFLNPLFMVYLWKEKFYTVKRPYEESIVFGTDKDDDMSDNKTSDENNQEIVEEVSDTVNNIINNKVVDTDSKNNETIETDKKIED